MRPEVYTAWRSQIEHAFAQQFPEFAPSLKRVRGEPRGILKFQWHPHPNLWCYVGFRPLDSEAFDALIGWSVHDRFPIADALGATSPQDVEDFDADSFIDWSLSFVPRSGAAHWSFWSMPSGLVDDAGAFADSYMKHFSRSLSDQEASQLVRPAIELGIAEVRDFGLPYLRRRAAYEERRNANSPRLT